MTWQRMTPLWQPPLIELGDAMRPPFTDTTHQKETPHQGQGAQDTTHNFNRIDPTQATQGHRLPAYGRALLDARMQGYSVPWLCIALSWNLGRAFPRVVVTPDTQAHELDLRLVHGLGCMVAHRGETSRARDVAEAALAAGAASCCVFDMAAWRLTATTAEVMAARGSRAAA